MDPHRWQQIKALLAECLELPPSRREDALDRGCGGDDALRAEVESLIDAAEAEGGGLEAIPAARALDAIDTYGARHWVGRTLGAYRLVALIARGGMGEVYRAERADGHYEQQVAVKVVRTGGDHHVLHERFDAERRILASLDHPNLAKLLDAGMTAEGVPYFVMELVRGAPIDAYCDEHRLSIEARVRLFRTVCQVVDYAHRQGVIHRDLKPANILVTGDGIVKLVDFGIAKRLAATDGGSTTGERTATAQRVLTPAYSSPEQIRGGPVTPASDVYALGVVLYRLLTQASPYGGATEDSYALSRAICETEPPRPSRAIGGPEVRDMRRRLRGDLDAVVLMALRKDPARRYASADALADDLFRHLEGLPVQARHGAWSYRAGRFLLRHRAAMGAVLLANLALAAGIAVAGYQAYEAHRQRERAERHFASVRTLANVLLLDVHTAIRNLPGSTPARQLLVRHALSYLEQLSAEARDDRALRLELALGYRNIGDIQGRPFVPNLGDPQGAQASYERALALLQPLASRERAGDAGYRDAQQELAIAQQRYGALLGALGRFKQAQAALKAGIDVADELAAADRAHRVRQLLRATLYGQLSQVQMFAGDIDAYQRTSDDAAQQLERLAAQQPADRDTTLSLATNYTTRGEYLIQRGPDSESAGLALEAFRKGLAVLQRMQTQTRHDTSLTRDIAIALDNIGACLLRLGQAQQAADHHRRAIGMLAELTTQDPDNAQFRADELSARAALGDALLAAGDVSASVAAAAQAVDGFEALPPGTRQDSFVRYRQGLAYYQLARALEARAALVQHGAAPRLADRQAACARYRQGLAILDDIEKQHGMAPGNTGPAPLREALGRCGPA